LEAFLGAISQKPFHLLMMTVESQKCCHFNADFSQGTGKNQLELGQKSVVTLLFAKKSLTKTDQCAGALL